MWRLIPLLILSQSAVLAHADYRHAQVRFTEGGVSLQRAAEMEAEEAGPNLPFLPGDRLGTNESGRAELQFSDGSVLRVDRRTKLDYANDDDEREPRVALRLWSGTLSLHLRKSGGRYDVDVRGGTFEVRRAGAYRVDLQAGESRLSVYEGEATFDADRRILIGAGERLSVRLDEAIGPPQRLDRQESDAFARWDAGRERQQADGAHKWAGAYPEDLPADVVPYAADLGAYGTWSYEAELGNVWRPSVSPGWRPYWDGRWAWTIYGWTWVPNEPWGWAPFHYGRWGFTSSLGWYWIPGGSWAPAWVFWALGTDTVGWCALDRHDRPVLTFETSPQGHAFPRFAAAGTTWSFVHQHELGSRDLARRHLEPTASLLATTRILESAHAGLTRDLRVTRTDHAVPRGGRAKLGPGDTVREHRTHSMTTIPRPAVRGGEWYVTRDGSMRRRYGREERQGENAAMALGSSGQQRVPPAEGPREEPGRTTHRDPSPLPRFSANPSAQPAPATRGERRVFPSEVVYARPFGSVPGASGVVGGPAGSSGQEVLRPTFDPLSRPRPPEGGWGSVAPRSGESHRGGSEAVHSRREPASPPAASSRGAHASLGPEPKND